MRHSIILLVLVSLGLGLLQFQTDSAQAATITVNSIDDELNVDGDCSLREAIQAANTNSAVDNCSAGSPTSTDDIVLANGGVYILGIAGSSEDSNQTGDLDIWDNTAAPDVSIYPSSGTATIDANDLDRVLHVQTGADLSLTNLTITNGTEFSGGGIYNEGILTLSQVSITYNQAEFAGGILNAQGTVNAAYSFIDNNTALSDLGGGLYNQQGTVTLDHTSISNNSAFGAAGIANEGTLTLTQSVLDNNASSNYDGGALSNYSGTVNVSASSFDGNSVTGGYGAAIMNSDILSVSATTFTNNTGQQGSAIASIGFPGRGTVTIQDSFIGLVGQGNTAQYGGGLFFGESDVTVTNTQIIGNTAQYGGGGYIAAGGIVTLDNTVVHTNVASAGGGAFYSYSGTLNLENGTLIGGVGNGNISNYGAGVYNYQGSLTVDASTISYNQSTTPTTGTGAGIYQWLGTAIINSSLITANATSYGAGINNYDATMTVTNSTIDGNIANTIAGGIYNFGTLTVTGTKIINNVAGNGGAIYSTRNVVNAMNITGSCIVGNSTVSVYNQTPLSQNFTGNWWGAVNGPGPVATGWGDTITINIDYSGFLTAPILGCPTLPTPTDTPTPTNTDTPGGPTNTPSDTPTATPTATSSFTPTATPSDTPIPTDTNTPGGPTDTATDIPTNTSIPSDTHTPTITPTNTVVLTDTPTPTNTPISTHTFTPSQTFTPSATTCALVAVPPNLISPVHRLHITDTTPTFSWSNVTGAESYRLFLYNTDRSFEFKKRTFNTTFTISPAVPRQKYQWRVRTQDALCETWTGWSDRNTLFID